MHDRYSTAHDLATELRAWLDEPHPQVTKQTTQISDYANSPQVNEAVGTASPSNPGRADDAIVPKGLCCFDSRDRDFFLRLLPGPRGRDGIPEQIRFWKEKFESSDPEETFQVGLIYGPSGCGKSSLVRAGILPLLGSHIRQVYVEATEADTEVRMLVGLRKHFPEIPRDLSLPQIITQLRQGRWLAPGEKVLFVIDQFEQWLHAKDIDITNQLVESLRQCDGRCAQAVVLARDDFWMAISRFFQELELPLAEHKNFAAVDLFDLQHARNVLQMFGQAYGRLSKNGRLAPDEEKFLDAAICQLSDHDKVICVRLVLFAETVKSKPWTIEVLNRLGDVQQIGTLFLEQTLDARAINPLHRLHAPAIRRILERLLPDAGTDIKAHFQSSEQLAEAAGQSVSSNDFRSIIQILDGELRLITPTEPDRGPTAIIRNDDLQKRYYQLTHDFLVPSIRLWIERKDRQSSRGRAKLKFKAHALAWRHSKQTVHLPSLLECLSYFRFIDKVTLADHERDFYSASMWQFGKLIASIAFVASVMIIVFAAVRINQRSRLVDAKISQLLAVGPAGLPTAIDLLRPDKAVALPKFGQLLESATLSPIQQLHVQLAIATLNPKDGEIRNAVLSVLGSIPEDEWANLLIAAKESAADFIPPIIHELELADEPNYKARLAILLFHLGNPTSLLQCLQIVNPNDLRFATMFAIGKCKCPTEDYLRYLDIMQGRQQDHDSLSGILTGLGRGDIAAWNLSTKSWGISIADELYRNSASNVMHSAAEYFLKKIGHEIDATSSIPNPQGKVRWIKSKFGPTMNLVELGRRDLTVLIELICTLESRSYAYEFPQDLFWLSNHEISSKLFYEFAADPANSRHFLRSWTPATDDSNCPATNLTVIQAMAFCNWLSVNDDLEPYYVESESEPIPLTDKRHIAAKDRNDDLGKYIKSVRKWTVDPKATGYFVPSLPELWIARFGESNSSFPMDMDGAGKILAEFEWYRSNSWNNFSRPYPVKMLWPNDQGFFDINGNVDEFVILIAQNQVSSKHHYLQGSIESSETIISHSAIMSYDFYSADNLTGFRVARRYHR